MKLRLVLLSLLTTLTVACGTHQQSVTNPAGERAARVEMLWWIMFWVLTAIFVLVVGWFLRAVQKRRGGTELTPEREVIDPARDRRMSRLIVALTIGVVLFELGFLVLSALATKQDRGIESKNPIEVQVIGHRWWWEFRYSNSIPSQTVTTANELHLPVGVPILIKASSEDVIHSFWAPNIAGKRDLIPGYQQSYWIKIDKEGAYRGQCAEFCGHQHAHMAFYVIGESQEKFDAWLQAHRQPAPTPSTPEQQRGMQVFMSSPCVTCHTIRGTEAGARVGPELTHLGTRSHIAAGTLANNRANLAKWVKDAQSVKPGNQMPSMNLNDDDLNALVSYLESLK